MSIEDLKNAIETAGNPGAEVVRIETYYAVRDNVHAVVDEIARKLPLVESGIDDFTESEKLIFAIIVKSFK